MNFASIILFWGHLGVAPSAAADQPAEEPVPEVLPYSDELGAALAPSPGGLTADLVAARAVASAPTIEEQRAKLQETAASVDETIARFVPNVSLSAGYTRISPADVNFGSGGGAFVGALNEGPLSVGPCPGGMGTCVLDSGGVPVGAANFGAIEVPLNNYSLQASLSVPFMDYALRLVPARRGARADTDAARLSRDAEKVRVQLDARLAYYDWLRARAQVAVTRQSVDRLTARLEDARVGEAAGVLTAADVSRLDGLVANAEAATIRAESFERLAARNLAVLMEDTRIDFVPGEDIMQLPPPAPTLEHAALTQQAMRDRLEVQAMRENLQVLDQGRRAARSVYAPRLDGFAEATYANPNQRFFPLEDQWRASWSVGATLSWRLDSFMNARAQVKQLEAGQRRVNASLVMMERAVAMEVAAAIEEDRRARASVALTARAHSAAEAAYDQQVALYQGGEATTTDIVEAEAERLSATLQDVNARINVHVAAAKLERATGAMKPLATPADDADRRYERWGSKPREGGAGT